MTHYRAWRSSFCQWIWCQALIICSESLYPNLAQTKSKMASFTDRAGSTFSDMLNWRQSMIYPQIFLPPSHAFLSSIAAFCLFPLWFFSKCTFLCCLEYSLPFSPNFSTLICLLIKSNPYSFFHPLPMYSSILHSTTVDMVISQITTKLIKHKTLFSPFPTVYNSKINNIRCK